MQNTDLNTSPYYDDFNENKDFHRVLFRPGFSVQARELTQLQTIQQNQVGKLAGHFFKDGSAVRPGQASFASRFYGVKIDLDALSSEEQTSVINQYKEAFASGEEITLQDQPAANNTVNEDTIIRANVLLIEDPTEDDPLIMYVQYLKSGGVNNDQTVFADDQDLYAVANGYTLPNLKSATTNSAVIGSSASIEAGEYFIREHIVRCSEQRIIVDKYSSTPNARIGLTVTENTVTPEEDVSLLDNAQGTSNFNAKGAHRLKISLTLTAKDLGSTDDDNFVELISVKGGKIQSKAQATEYSVLAETLARRTRDQAGDYLVEPFTFNVKENLDDGFNNGLYVTGQTTDSGNEASDDLFSVVVSPGKGVINGYESQIVGQRYVDIEKARDVEVVQGAASTVELGNYVLVSNTYGAPSLSFSGSQSHVPYTQLNLHDNFTASKINGGAALGEESSSFAAADGQEIGVARARGFELFDGDYTVTDALNQLASHKLYLFDVRMITEVQLDHVLPNNLNLDVGDKVIGQTSKATGTVHRSSEVSHTIQAEGYYTQFSGSAVGTFIDYSNHNFQNGEKVKYEVVSGSTIGGLSDNTDYYIIYANDNQIQLATSLVDAQNKNALTMSAAGGTHRLRSYTKIKLDPDVNFPAVGNIAYESSGSGLSILPSEGTRVTRIYRDDLLVDLEDEQTSIISNLIDTAALIDFKSTYLYLISTIGSFVPGEELKSTTTQLVINNSILQSARSLPIHVAASNVFNLNQVKSIFGQNYSISSYATTPTDVFTCDVASTLTEDNINKNTTYVNRAQLTGTVQVTCASRILIGSGTKFKSELIPGDILEVATGIDGSSEFIQIEFVTSDTKASFFVIQGNKENPISPLVGNTGDGTVTFPGRSNLFATPADGNILSYPEDSSGVANRKVVIGGCTDDRLNGTFVLTKVNDDNATFEPDGAAISTLNETNLQSIFIYGLTFNKSSIPAIRLRTQMVEQNKNILVKKLSSDNIKSLDSDEYEYKIRREYYQTVSAGQSETINVTDGVFEDIDEDDYSVTITGTTNSSDSPNVGQNLNVKSVLSRSAGVLTVNIGTDSNYSHINEVKIIATIRREQTGQKQKNIQKSKLVLIDNSNYHSTYGTSYKHNEISLGFADIQNVHAIYEGPLNGDDPTLPQWSLSSTILGPNSADFIVGESFKQQNTNALGLVVKKTSSTLIYVPLSDNPLIQSTENKIVGLESGAQATLNTPIEHNSTNIISNFIIDDGQRDNYYDIGKIIRKPNKSEPKGKLLAVLDYFDHSTGDFLSVNSYNNQVEFDQIPSYFANRVDPEEPQPAGDYELADSIDFRPRVSNVAVQSGSINTVPYFKVGSYSMDFTHRYFYNTSAQKIGASTSDVIKSNTDFNYGYSKYLGRIDSLFLDESGKIIVSKGAPAEYPIEPKKVENAMHIAVINIPPYTFSASDVSVTPIDHARYTMKDIAGIDKRLKNFEYYTALSLLEQDTSKLEVLDENGLNRFKSGFLIDSFKGHGIGDVGHPDYNNAIDFKNRELRPRASVKNIKLSESATNDTERLAAGYAKTGDLVTLPYTNVVSIQQPYASSVEKVNPVLTFSWVGSLKLTPSRDEWFEIGTVEKRVVAVEEGDYDHLLKQAGADPSADSFTTREWGAWTQIGTGSRIVSSENVQVVKQAGVRARQGRGRGSRIRTADKVATVTRTIVQNTASDARTGLQQDVRLRIDERVVGDVVVNDRAIRFMRSTADMGADIHFQAYGLKPKSRLYAFFDKADVSYLITPKDGSEGDNIVSDSTGKSSGTFRIPDPKSEGNPQFETGLKTFRITSSPTNSISNDVETYAEGTFDSSGILQRRIQDVIQTRNAEVATQSITEFRTRDTTRSQTDSEIPGTEQFINWRDPLAQSFLPTSKSGEYITKIDVFFSQKDNQGIPISLQIREMENGYPTQTILPFGKVTLDASDVNESLDASVPTTFTFDSPVYVKGGREYCMVLMSDSNKYLAYISRIGETDVGGTRFISEQPYLGSLFKSQNNSTWTANQGEDLKFTIYRAQFDTSATAEVVLANNEVPVKKLVPGPFESFNNIETIETDGISNTYGLSYDLDDFNVNSVSYASSIIASYNGKVINPTTVTKNSITFADISLPCTYTNGSATVTIDNPSTVADLIVGMTVSGTGMPSSTTIQSIDGPNEITLDNPVSDPSGANSVTFGAIPAATDKLTIRYLIDKIKVTHANHHMYQSTSQNTAGTISNYVAFNNITPDQTGSIVSIDNISVSVPQIFNSNGTSTLDPNKSYIVETTTGDNKAVFQVTSAADGSVSSLEILNPGSGFSAGTVLLDFTGVDTGNNITQIGNIVVSAVEDTLFGLPLPLLQRSAGFELQEFGMDYYTIQPPLSSYDISHVAYANTGGGSNSTATENIQYNTLRLLIPTIEHANTSIDTAIKSTSGLSPGVYGGNIAQDSFKIAPVYKSVNIDDNNDMLYPKLIASQINQDQHMSGKSLFVKLTLKTDSEYLSPIIDLDAKSVIAVGNRFSNVDSRDNVWPKSSYIAPTEPEGDSGETIYMTRKVQLSTPARSIKVYFDAIRGAASEFQVMYKVLRSDDTSDFDELGWSFINNGSTTGTNSDFVINPSEFYTEYQFTEDDIDEFIAFSVKIRMQGINTSQIPKIKDLRVLALAT